MPEQFTLFILAGVPGFEPGLHRFGDEPRTATLTPYNFYCMTTNRTCFLVTDYIVHYQVATTGCHATTDKVYHESFKLIGDDLCFQLEAIKESTLAFTLSEAAILPTQY